MQWNKASRVTGTRQSLGYHEPLLLSSCYMAQKNMHWLWSDTGLGLNVDPALGWWPVGEPLSSSPRSLT